MKLAEALLIRADQKKKILSLRERIAQNALAQEGDDDLLQMAGTAALPFDICTPAALLERLVAGDN